MFLSEKTHDARATLAGELLKVGINKRDAQCIALDAGRDLVDKAYLEDIKLQDDTLKSAESLVQRFYWGDFE